MSKIEEVKNLVAHLCDLVQSGQYDMEFYCLDNKGNKIDTVSELTCKSQYDPKDLAIMVILDTLERIIIGSHNRCEFNAIRNISNESVTIHGIRAKVKLPNDESVSRDWIYTSHRTLFPDDELDIAVNRHNVGRKSLDV